MKLFTLVACLSMSAVSFAGDATSANDLSKVSTMLNPNADIVAQVSDASVAKKGEPMNVFIETVIQNESPNNQLAHGHRQDTHS